MEEQVFLSLTRKPVPPIEKEKLVFVLLQLMINVCFNNTLHLLPPQQIKSTIINGSSKQVRWACKYVSYSIYIFTQGYIIYNSIYCKHWFLLIKLCGFVYVSGYVCICTSQLIVAFSLYSNHKLTCFYI